MISSAFFLSLKCNEPSDTQNSDAISTSSDLLNLLLGEDLCSATGSALSRSGASATSDSLGSSSLGCDASQSRAGMFVLRAHGCASQCLHESHRTSCPHHSAWIELLLPCTAGPSHQNSESYLLASNFCVNEDVTLTPAFAGPVRGSPGHWTHMCRHN